MSRQQLLIFHLDDGRELRGGQRQVLYLVKELAGLGHLNYIVCRAGSPLEKAAKEKKINTLPLPYFFEWDPVSALMLSSAIRRLTAGENGLFPAVLHSHTSHAAAVSYLTSLLAPSVRIVHKRVDYKIENRLSLRFKYGGADKIVAVADAVRDILVHQGLDAGKVATIPSSIDLGEIPWTDENIASFRAEARARIHRDFRVGDSPAWIGTLISLTVQKNPANLIKSAELVLASRPDAKFLIAGSGPLLGILREMSGRLNIADSVFFLGYYPRPYEFLSAIDLFVLPSSREGLPNVIMQALASGIPVVTTDAGGSGELIRDTVNGLIVPPDNPEELARAQLRLISDEPLRKILVREGYKSRADFSSRKMAELTLKIYEQEIANFEHHRHPVA